MQNLNMHDHAEAKADPNEEGLMLKVQILVEHSPWLKGMILSERSLAQTKPTLSMQILAMAGNFQALQNQGQRQQILVKRSSSRAVRNPSARNPAPAEQGPVWHSPATASVVPNEQSSRLVKQSQAKHVPEEMRTSPQS